MLKGRFRNNCLRYSCILLIAVAVTTLPVRVRSDRRTPERSEVAARHPIRLILHSERLMSFAVSPDGRILATLKHDYYPHGPSHYIGTISLYRITDGRLLRTWPHPMTTSPALSFSPDGQILVSGSTKMQPPLHLWNVADGRLLRDISTNPWIINAVAFSPDGQTLATANHLFRVSDGQLLQSFTNTKEPVAFTPDGKMLVTGSGDDTIKLWKVGQDHFQTKLNAHQHDLMAFALSPDGKYLAASQRTLSNDRHRLGGLDNVISLWRLQDGKLLRRMSRPLTDVFHMAFSPDGHLLAAAGEESVTLWRVKDGQMAQRFEGASRPVAFLAHSDQLATGSPEGGVKFWRLLEGP